MSALILRLAALLAVGHAAPTSDTSQSPSVHVRNGTYAGVRNTHFDQDFFLGIPYAQQPVGGLRFTVPHSLNESWEGSRDAKAYSDICVGYGTDSIWYPMSESCLTVNIIRGSSADETSKLPVGVWIHGGGFYQGSGADQRYNMSAIVENSYKIGKPFIAVTLNYRLGSWGFLSSNEVVGTGNTNLGLRDQRLALQWVQENIGAFGGDPEKVTIWGESAGAMSVGYHLTAYGGRDDRLFRAAIMQSGGSVFYRSMNMTGNQALYDDIVAKTNCSAAVDTLQCLRGVPYETLNGVLNGTDGAPAYSFLPMVDGDFLRNWGSVQLEKGEFVSVPIIAGTNTDEGTGFGPTGVNTTEEFYTYLTEKSNPPIPPTIATEILSLYPDDPSVGIPAYLDAQRIPSKGLQWRRTSAFAGDYKMHAARRQQCVIWATASAPAYCYRFNQRSAAVPELSGATHFEEVAFVQLNLDGWGYHYGKPFEGMPASYAALSRQMSSMWATFISEMDPNGEGLNSSLSLKGRRGNTGNDTVHWDAYSVDSPVDIVFEAQGSHMEADTWRGEAIAYINSVARGLWR